MMSARRSLRLSKTQVRSENTYQAPKGIIRHLRMRAVSAITVSSHIPDDNLLQETVMYDIRWKEDKFTVL